MKNLHLQVTALALLPAALVPLSSCSSTTPPPEPKVSSTVEYEEGVPGGLVVSTIEIRANVTKIDKEKREATLMGSDGEEVTVTVGPEAVNFDQLMVGDQVRATVTEELLIFMDDADAPALEGAAAAVELPAEGAAPGGRVAGAIQMKGEVIAIDAEQRTATLRFGDGTVQTFTVRDDLDLGPHQVGQQVVFRVTQMLALDIEKM